MNSSGNPQKSPAPRRAACPGFYNMPKASDGRLCRIKLPLGNIALNRLACIADFAEQYGSGNIELTTRGNIQLRGIKDGSQTALSAALTEFGLAPPMRGGDNIRNIMINPTAGFDICGNAQVLSVAESLLAEVQANAQYCELSPKFSFYIDGGEDCAVPNHDNDIWLSFLPCPDGQEALCCIGLASALPLSGRNIAENILGAVSVSDCLSVIYAILDCFMEAMAKNGRLRRIKDWIEICGSETVCRELLSHIPALRPAPRNISAYFAERRRKLLLKTACSDIDFAMKSLALGIHETRIPEQYYLGAAPKLGRFSAPSLRSFTRIAEQILPQAAMRITAQQTIIFAPCPREKAEYAKQALTDAGFITDIDNIYAHMLCCAGAPFCSKGKANIQQDAAYLASELKKMEIAADRLGIIHLTACPKSCAASEARHWTLLALGDNAYAVYSSVAGGVRQNNSRLGCIVAPYMHLSDIPSFLAKQI